MNTGMTSCTLLQGWQGRSAAGNAQRHSQPGLQISVNDQIDPFGSIKPARTEDGFCGLCLGHRQTARMMHHIDRNPCRKIIRPRGDGVRDSGVARNATGRHGNAVKQMDAGTRERPGKRPDRIGRMGRVRRAQSVRCIDHAKPFYGAALQGAHEGHRQATASEITLIDGARQLRRIGVIQTA